MKNGEGYIDNVDDDDTVIEPENWRNPEEQQFNHQALVMSAMRKCLDLGSKELREGWWEEKTDKMGNIKRVWHEDTRKAFIESVRSLLMIMSCDFDEEAEEKIPKLLKNIEDRKKFWMDEEYRWWTGLNVQQQQKLKLEGKEVRQGFFNKKLDFDNLFFEEETQIYREIFSECNKQTYRLDFYESVGIMA